MRKRLVLGLGLAAFACLSGCKFVRTEEVGRQAAATGQSGDPARIAALIEESYAGRLLPLLEERAVDAAVLRGAVAAGLDSAGEAHGLKMGGAAGAWNFALRGTGTVLEEDRSSQAGVLRLDLDGDGAPDAVLQIGPVVRGTALRDATPLYDFSNFRDQIEFARLGRALNDKALAELALQEGSLTGRRISFLGAASLRSAGDPLQILPVAITEAAP